MDLEFAATTIRRFITGKLLESGLSGYVIGLSGGVDSSLVASLAVQAVGPDKLYGLLLPHRSSPPESVKHARHLAERLGIRTGSVEIASAVDELGAQLGNMDRVREGNLAARLRMAALFDQAKARNALVLGTGNRSESCLGYTTWHGDSAASIHPIAELYKSEVVKLARMVGVPDMIVNKPPSADLWEGQTDETELGIAYSVIDPLLGRLIDDNERSLAVLTAEGFDQVEVSRVVSLLNRTAFKRILPATAPLGRVAVPQKIQLKV